MILYLGTLLPCSYAERRKSKNAIENEIKKKNKLPKGSN
jgi:hypothetical protein